MVAIIAVNSGWFCCLRGLRGEHKAQAQALNASPNGGTKKLFPFGARVIYFKKIKAFLVYILFS